MRRIEVLLGLLLVGFGGFIATRSRGIARPPARAEAAPAPAEQPVAASGSAGGDYSGVTATVRQSTSTAPFRDRADIHRRLTISGPGTYIAEMLASQDSALQRWAERDRPLYVWIQPAFRARDWRGSYVGAARDAFMEWRSAGLPFDFTFVVDSSRADVHLYWTERLAQGRRIGMTYRVHDQHGWITGGHIVIALQTVDGHTLPERLVRATAVHEAGHLVGLNHTTDTTSIMTSSATGRAAVGLADRATLRLLYSLPPGSVR